MKETGAGFLRSLRSPHSPRPPTKGLGPIPLVLVLAATALTLAAGTLLKKPCASGDWRDGRQYRQLCYSDIVPLYGTESLRGGRLPFIDQCPTSPGSQCDEYPVLTMYLMRLSAWIGHSYFGFFFANAFFLGLLALATAWTVYAIAGERALYFAVAPTLLIYAFVNWDLLAVALATAGTLAYLRDRDDVAGILLGLGAAAKFYPALLLIPFAAGRVRDRRTGGAVSLVAWAGVAYGVVNIPFVLASPHAWATFFRFNSSRPADWDSIWFIVCSRLHHGTGCSWSARGLNVWSLLLFVGAAVLLWRARASRDPGFPRWSFGFPLLAVFLLANKVYSPQYGLWLLPWFATSLPDARLFVAFEAADMLVFVTRFSWFGRLSNLGGVPLGAFQLALVARAAVLILCLVTWVVRSGDEGLERVDAGALASPVEA